MLNGRPFPAISCEQSQVKKQKMGNPVYLVLVIFLLILTWFHHGLSAYNTEIIMSHVPS